MMTADQMHHALTFATSGIDRFADHSTWTRLPSGEPLLQPAARWMRGKVVDRVIAGTATVLTVEVLETHIDNDADPSVPLVNHDRTWHTLGEHSRVS